MSPSPHADPIYTCSDYHPSYSCNFDDGPEGAWPPCELNSSHFCPILDQIRKMVIIWRICR